MDRRPSVESITMAMERGARPRRRSLQRRPASRTGSVRLNGSPRLVLATSLISLNRSSLESCSETRRKKGLRTKKRHCIGGLIKLPFIESQMDAGEPRK